MTFRKTAVKESSYSVAEYERDLTNGGQSFILPLLLMINDVITLSKCLWKPRALVLKWIEVDFA